MLVGSCTPWQLNILVFFSLEAALRGLLGALTSTPYSPTQHLEREQALAKQFAEILHFTLRFDELKVVHFLWESWFPLSSIRGNLVNLYLNDFCPTGELDLK